MPYRRLYLFTALVAVVLLAAAALLSACGGSGGSAASPIAAVASAAASTSPLATSDTQAVRDLANAYWTAYNAYDADKALSYLEKSYGASQDKTVRSEIGQIKTFGVKLGVKEKSAPVLNGADTAQMFLTMSTPTGKRLMLMKFKRVGGAWTITYVQEVK